MQTSNGKQNGTGIFQWQMQAEKLYQDFRIQLFVASLIVTNFITFMVSKQIDPKETLYVDFWRNLDLFYNTIFAFELGLNMYGRWFCRFWSDAWNVFDFLVVSIGLLDTAKVDLGPLRMLRMMRAFRVFRLFKKIDSLNKIIMSLFRAVPGMFNAFLINLIFMCIYAVLAVDFFGHVGEDCEETKLDIVITSRGACFGFEYYGNFAKSLYTLFQVLTGDSWSEAVVRPILLYYDGWYDQLGAGLFFVSFILINAVILINVVIAVLLDKMAATTEDMNENPDLNFSEGASHPAASDAAAGAIESDPVAAMASDLKGLRAQLNELSKESARNGRSDKAEMQGLMAQLTKVRAVLEGGVIRI